MRLCYSGMNVLLNDRSANRRTTPGEDKCSAYAGAATAGVAVRRHAPAMRHWPETRYFAREYRTKIEGRIQGDCIIVFCFRGEKIVFFFL